MSETNFLRQQAYVIIQKKILDGELRAGQLVSELALAKEIGMSRTPVREAIGQLQLEGLFTKVTRVGTIVRLPDYDELKDLYEVREALESYVTKIASDTLASDDLAAMERSIEEIWQISREVRDAGSDLLDEALLRRFFTADIAFHSAIIQSAGNKRVTEIVGEFRIIQRVYEYDRMSHDLQLIEGAAAQHADILAKLRQGDGEAARIAMAAHIKSSQQKALASFPKPEVEETVAG